MNATEHATAEELKSLVAAAAPAVTGRPDLPRLVLAAMAAEDRRRRRSRRLGAAAGSVAVFAAIAASGFAGQGDYRDWTMPSSAMRPTVQVEQKVVVSKHARPQRGDVVLLTARSGGREVEGLGQVFGLPGDTVSCPAEADGTCSAVVVSGQVLDEPWLTAPTDPFPPAEVPAGRFFFLGDDRGAANDSRFIGPQPLDGILGVVVARTSPDGTAERLPGTPPHDLPDGSRPVDPAEPVPPASSSGS